MRLEVPRDCGGVEALLDCGCIQPVPVEDDSGGDDADGAEKGKDERSSLDDGDKDEEGDSSKKTDGNGEQSNREEEEEDDPWRNELSTIGKEIGGETQSPWCIETTCTFECAIASSNSNNNTTNNENTNNNDHPDNSKTRTWAVEGVTILQSNIERSSSSFSSKNPKSCPISALLFDVEIAVRGNGVMKQGTQETLEEGNLELRAVLRQRRKYRGVVDGNGGAGGSGDAATGSRRTSSSAAAMSLLEGKRGNAGIAAGLLGLELGGGALSPDFFRHPPSTVGFGKVSATGSAIGPNNELEMHYGTKILRTSPPLRVCAKLIPPLQLSVREVCGARAASGSTLVEITVEHSSEWHKEAAIVTGIAFHPGQSRLWCGGDSEEGGDGEGDTPTSPMASSSKPSEGKSMQGGELSVFDMSRRVRWGFAPGTAPDLPLVLGPHEAFATVIQIDAGEDVRSRAFLSPISVNAMIGSNDVPVGNSVTKSTIENSICTEEEGERVMVTTDAIWTTSRVAVENSDAFRVDMFLRGGLQTVCRVGAPLIVSLRVLNLSMEPRDLMLLMAKDGEGRISGDWERSLKAQGKKIHSRRGSFYSNVMGGTMLHNRAHFLQHQNHAVPAKENHSFNTAVVSEVNGYTFGVWGLSGDDDGTTRHHRDHELLAVDAALLLGEVKGQHSIEAELRFVPLREGTLDVPNLKIYDKRGGRWYNCVHTLKIVAAAKA